MFRRVTQDGMCLVKDNGSQLRINEKKKDRIWTIQLVGDVDNESAWEVFDEISAFISLGDGVILDMSETTHLSSTMAERLIVLQRSLEDTPYEGLPIVQMPRKIYDELSEMGLNYMFDITLKEGAE